MMKLLCATEEAIVLLFKRVDVKHVRLVGGVLVKSAKGFIIGLGVCVIIGSILAQALIISGDSLIENSAFRGICPLH